MFYRPAGEFHSVELIGVSPAFLRLVHGGIRCFGQILRTACIIWKDADADARRCYDFAAVYDHGFADGFDDLVSQNGGILGMRYVIQDDGEFVAAESGHTVFRPHASLKARPHDLQKLVARRVAHCVVNALEMVQVEKEQCHLAGMPLGAFQPLFQGRRKCEPVGQPCQGIMMRKLAHLLFRLFYKTYIGQNGNVVRYAAVIVLDDPDVLPCGKHLSVLAPVPYLALPLTVMFKGFPELLVERRPMPPGLLQPGVLAHDFLCRKTGDVCVGVVDRDDVPVGIRDQDGLGGAVEHRSGLAQSSFSPLTVTDVGECGD